MLSYRDIDCGLRKLGLEETTPIIVHTSLKAFGEIRGGAGSMLGALLANFNAVMMPTFTYKTMIVPEDGPESNGIIYGSGKDRNKMAVPFDSNMPADKLMGVLPETLRQEPEAKRSTHPILSFTGIGVDDAIHAQSLKAPLAPISELATKGGWVLLLGVDHSVNTSIHFAEKMAGRRQFIRWALEENKIVECSSFPGCSNGFNQLEMPVSGLTVRANIGNAEVQAIPLMPMLDIAIEMISNDHQALLCNNPECERCRAVRANSTALE
jgi:aminoglycoside 3-N-acetyltransferase